MHAGPPPRTVAVIGASSDRAKFGNRAVRAYAAEDWTVAPVNGRGGTVEGRPAYRSILEVPGPVHRATVYLHPEDLLGVLAEIACKGVAELYLNPGSESPEVLARAGELGLAPILACSIVAIGRSPYAPDGERG